MAVTYDKCINNDLITNTYKNVSFFTLNVFLQHIGYRSLPQDTDAVNRCPPVLPLLVDALIDS